MAGKTARARSGGELPVVLCAGLATRAGRQPRKKEKVVRKRPHEIARGAQREVELRASVEEICCVSLCDIYKKELVPARMVRRRTKSSRPRWHYATNDGEIIEMLRQEGGACDPGGACD